MFFWAVMKEARIRLTITRGIKVPRVKVRVARTEFQKPPELKTLR
jgi:hypothetical protein